MSRPTWGCEVTGLRMQYIIPTESWEEAHVARPPPLETTVYPLPTF